jgi:hypothetical protein
MVCYLKLINKLGMIDFLKTWEPFTSEKELREIAEKALKKLEKSEGHNYELIRKRALDKDYWQTLLLEELREWKRRKWVQKKRIRKVEEEEEGEIVEETSHAEAE